MYGTPEELMELTQITPDDLFLVPAENQTREERLTELLEKTLLRAKDMVNTDRNRDYDEEVRKGERLIVPPGIEDIALRIASNIIHRMIERQNAKVMSRQDMTMHSMTFGSVFTKDVEEDLAMYPKKAQIGISRVRSAEELYEASRLQELEEEMVAGVRTWFQ